MIEGGVILCLVGFLLALANPVERTIAHRRHAQVGAFEDTLRGAFPLHPPTPAFDDLVSRAETALEQDALSRGIRATAATYDQASEGDACRDLPHTLSRTRKEIR